jgi:hypothetical protein
MSLDGILLHGIIIFHIGVGGLEIAHVPVVRPGFVHDADDVDWLLLAG